MQSLTQREEVSLSTPTTYRFGPFELRSDGGLYRDGVRLPLTPQPLQLLRLLLENAGDTVSRAAIQERIWGHGFLEVDLGINRCIREIRAVLRDDPRSPVYIETYVARGYRFVAPVAKSSPVDGGEGLHAPDPPSRTAILGRWVIGGAVAVLAFVFALAEGDSRAGELEGLPREDRRAVAQADVLLDRRSGRGIDRAIDLLEDLLERHPKSAAIHARLAYAHSTLDQEWGRKGHTNAAREHATRAAAAGSGHPEALLAAGAARYGRGHRDEALADLEAAHAAGADGPFAAILLASTLRDQGRWSESTETLEDAFERYPRSFELSYSLVWNAIFAHDFESARGHLEHMKLLDPGHHLPRVILPMVVLRETGNSEALRRVVEREASVIGIGTVLLATRQMSRLFGDLFSETPEAFTLHGLLVPRTRVNLHKAEGFWYARRPDLAIPEYGVARDLLRSELEAEPDDVEITISLAAAYAGLGVHEQAIDLVDRALERTPITGPVPDALLLRVYAAEVLTRVGEEDRALDLLEFLVGAPSVVTPHLLDADPVWRPLFDQPRFQRLLPDREDATAQALPN